MASSLRCCSQHWTALVRTSLVCFFPCSYSMDQSSCGICNGSHPVHRCIDTGASWSLKQLNLPAAMWPGPSIRRCVQQRSPSGLLEPALARRACLPSWYPARLLAACTATCPPRRLPSQPPLRLRSCPQCPPWTSTSRSGPTTLTQTCHVYMPAANLAERQTLAGHQQAGLDPLPYRHVYKPASNLAERQADSGHQQAGSSP